MSPALARHDTILTWADDAAGGHILKTTYWASQGHEEIAQVGGLVNRPDPCEFVQFDFIEARTRGPSDDNSHRDDDGPGSARFSVHQLWIQVSGGQLEPVQTYEGTTHEGDVLTYQPEKPIENVVVVRVLTTKLGDLAPAWHEISLWSPNSLG